ncbi:M23 family metallopeptidase [Thiocystis violascens]|uniref:Metalloendopeptidase-like membrane protein n=1 Tax=Thiocystis violascens (strain ATCC 17096 / DSM 198 / 6111) TaxID=765911 RepID=I3Y9B9_THIV6|nr:M23 family metallopeptidase [Thiocystis violascens]AFL73587.1 metalloendopeptidase-like membrane protein [Thiocystis violascens DSM 198]
MPGCPAWVRRLVLVVGIGGAPMTTVVRAAESGTDPLATPQIRLITRDHDRVVRAIRVIQAEPTPALSTAVRRASGTWRWPVWGRLTSGYGRRRHPVTQDPRFHAGIDLAAPIGTPVRAVADGQVRMAGWAGGYGRLVELEHGQGWTTRYGHLQRALVAPGERVEAGEIIALVGSTGRSTGAHLHFEIRRHGRPVDPLTRLAARPGQSLAQRSTSRAGVGG